MNIAEEFAEHLVDLTRHDAQPGEISSEIIQFLACRADRGTGGYPLGPLLAQLEDELLCIASRLRADPRSGYDTRLDVSGHAPDRIARKAADLRWAIRDEAKKLAFTLSVHDALANSGGYEATVRTRVTRLSGDRRRTSSLGRAQRAPIGALTAFLAVLFGQMFLIAWTVARLAL